MDIQKEPKQKETAARTDALIAAAREDPEDSPPMATIMGDPTESLKIYQSWEECSSKSGRTWAIWPRCGEGFKINPHARCIQ